jgi:uncharacterized protein (TIGR02466 family)
MSIQSFFPTQLWISQAPPSLRKNLNSRLNREARALEKMDEEGLRWSKKNYRNGYTSYASVTNLPYRSTSFQQLKKWIDSEVKKFSRQLEIDLMKGQLEMTTCWVNIMRQNCSHAFHLHPLSVISGTYYLEIPSGSGALKIEDPRLPAFMGSPPRRPNCAQKNQRFHEFYPKTGQLILFESWLKHEVPPHRGASERISISFNYDWIR